MTFSSSSFGNKKKLNTTSPFFLKQQESNNISELLQICSSAYWKEFKIFSMLIIFFWYLTNFLNNPSEYFRQAEWKIWITEISQMVSLTLNVLIPRIDSYSISYFLVEKICISVIKKWLLKPETCFTPLWHISLKT